MIYCIKHNGRPLRDETDYLLFRKGLEMYARQIPSMAIQSDECAGTIRSDFEYIVLGDIYGIRYVADLYFDTGRHLEMEFVIHDCDLARAHVRETMPGALNARWN